MADSKITALTSISTSTDPAVDPLVIVDVSDTSMAATGTTKKVTLNNLLSSSPTATGAFSVTGLVTAGSATITGDLTAARLIVTGGTIPTNGLWLATTNTLEFAANSLAQYRIAPLGVFSWFDGAGGTRMTLNSTGLGVGVAPSAGKFEVLETGTGSGLGGIFASTATAGGNPGFVFRTASTNRWSISLTGTAGAESIRFYDVNAAATRLTVDSAGNLGIGVTPNAIANVIRLEIGGALGTNLTLRSSSTNVSARNWMVGANVNAFGDFVIRQSNSQGAEPNSGTDRLMIDSSGNLILQSSATPATLTTNGQLTVNATSNTNLRFSYRGSDGTTRVANLTLA